MKLTVKQKAGLKLLTSSLRKKYPFINGFDVIPTSFERYGTLITVNIRFDLEKFYKYYNVGPPKRYFDATYLFTNMTIPRGYLMSYVDDEDEDNFRNEFNNTLEKSMNTYYEHLPSDMTITKFQGWSDEELIRQQEEYGVRTPGFYSKWRDSGEPVDLRISDFVPENFDVTKYYTED